MKYLCDACERLVEPAGFRTEGEVLVLRCSRCEAESRHAAAAPALRAVPDAEPERSAVVPFAPRAITEDVDDDVAPPAPVPAAERCPKCATPKQGRDACARCGLVFELYRPEQDLVPASARRDFAQLLEGWGSPQAEQKLQHLGTGATVNLARLARHHLADFPGDPRATALLERLTARSLALASAAAQSEGLARQAGPSTGKLVLTALALLSIAGALALAGSLWHHG